MEIGTYQRRATTSAAKTICLRSIDKIRLREMAPRVDLIVMTFLAWVIFGAAAALEMSGNAVGLLSNTDWNDASN
jgi:hypothetical protein